MAVYTTIDDPAIYFNTKLTTGTGSAQAVTGLGFQPDLIWGKRRDSTGHPTIFDSVRGITKGLETNGTGAEFTSSDYYTAFGSDGFTIAAGASGAGNGSSQTAVQWCWKESATAGFDILTYEGSGSAKTVSHNLGVKPDWIIVKNIDSNDPAFNWRSYHSALGAGIAMKPNGTDATSDDPGYWNDTEPTSSVFSVKDSGETNNSGQTYIAYLFAEKKGYSKLSGTYVGNGNADGTFIYTGFRPAWVMIKRTTSTNGWEIYDNKRVGYNTSNSNLRADTNAADDATYPRVDLHSNGFKIRASSTGVNTSGAPYIYMAFAEAPFVNSNGVPNNAR